MISLSINYFNYLRVLYFFLTNQPQVILGNGDQFLSNLLPIFKMSFFIPLFGDVSKKFQPVLIDDIVEFLSKMIEETAFKEKLFELGGPDIFTYKEFYSNIAEKMNKKNELLDFRLYSR